MFINFTVGLSHFHFIKIDNPNLYYKRIKGVSN